MQVRLLWLFIGILSHADWIGGVITDDELAMLIICTCSSWNVLKKHIFIQQFLLFQVSLHHHLREYHDACVWCLLF